MLISFLVILLHAIVMPIQYDEAYMVLHLYGFGPLSPLLMYENPNNHPLLGFIVYFLLPFKSILLFRLPSLLCSFVVFHFVKKATGSSYASLAVAVTPLFFDYLAMERGYALGLALLLLGIMSSEKWWCTVLFALSVFCVPTMAPDVMIVCVAMMSRRGIMLLIASGMLSLVLYGFIVQDVFTSILSLGSDKLVEAGRFFAYMSAIPFAGYLIAGFAAYLSARNIRGKDFFDLSLLLALPLVFIGFPRNHLFLALVILIVILRAFPKRILIMTYVAVSFALLPQDVIMSEPETHPVTAYSYARSVIPCLSIQNKGMFIVLQRYYQFTGTEGSPKYNCPYFLMVDQPTLRIPASFKIDTVLGKYGAGIYRYNELKEYVQSRVR